MVTSHTPSLPLSHQLWFSLSLSLSTYNLTSFNPHSKHIQQNGMQIATKCNLIECSR